MNKKQYNNVIDWTLKHEQAAKSDDSLETARAIFKNMGVALPGGSMQEVFETIKTNNYMGWKACTMEEAQQAADRGVAAIGISEDQIVVLAANDEDEPVAQTASVMTLSENNTADTASAMQYYTYSNSTTTEDSGVSQTVLFFEHSNLSVSVGWSGYNQLYGSTVSTIYWTSSNTNVASVDYYTGLIHAKQGGVATITATTNDSNYVARCTVTVNYCGGEDYRDVTKHTLVLLDSGYYVCSKCGYRIKSPALQDRDILSDEDYYKVLSCCMSIPYYAKIDGEDIGRYSIRATALRLIIDDIRSKSQYAQEYEYVGNDGKYKREYTIGNENDNYYMPVAINYNVIDNDFELIRNNGVASGIIELFLGWAIPSQYQYLFLDIADVYTNLTDFLCGLAEEVGYKGISIILKWSLFAASINGMAVTDKMVKIQFTVGAAVYESKTVFDSNGYFKFQEHSVC